MAVRERYGNIRDGRVAPHFPTYSIAVLQSLNAIFFRSVAPSSCCGQICFTQFERMLEFKIEAIQGENI
jgi:hypothetical protein